MDENRKEKIMEQNIDYLFIIAIPVITLILYLINKGLVIFTIIGGFFILSLLYIYHSKDRKERLNIIKDKEMLYFHLSDDLLFFVQIDDEERFNEILRETIYNEMATIKEIVYKIEFVNFKNDKLNQELNALIK
jgi:hypothetical protein